MLFLGVELEDFLRAAAVLLLWAEGYVEPVVPPAAPLHVLAQQLLGTVLQEGAIGGDELSARGEALGWGLADEIVDWLESEGFLDRDGDLLFVGEEAERRYGRVHYRDLVAVFTAPPQFVVLHGRAEIGQIDPLMLTRKVDGPRVILLGGRPWQVTYTDWKRKRAYVEPAESAGEIRWVSSPVIESYAVSDAVRRVLLGAEPAGGVRMTKRATAALADVRREYADRVSEDATVIVEESTGPRWWTWAGARANAVLVAALAQVAPELLDDQAYNNQNVRLRGDVTAGAVTRALWEARQRFGPELAGVKPEVTEEAVRELKFSELLPPDLAVSALAERNADRAGAASVLVRPPREATW